MIPTPEQAALAEAAERVATDHLRPAAAAADRTEQFPEDAWDALAEAELTGIAVPETHGGLGVDRTAYALVNEALASGMLAVATALSVHCLAVECIDAFGTAAQRDRWLPAMADGRPVGAFALSDPNAGSNPAEMSTVARPVDDGYVLDGRKQWITNGQRAGVYVVFARTDAEREDTITQFLVPADAEGLTVTAPEEKLGLRASDTTGLEFDGVALPESARLTPVGEGLKAALSVLTGGRIGIAAQSVGVAQAAIDATVEHVPIDPSQSVRHRLADIHARTQAARQVTHHAARTQDDGGDARTPASVAKYVASEAAVEVTGEAVDLCGFDGHSDALSVERLHRDARVTTIYEGTSEIQKTIIARELL